MRCDIFFARFVPRGRRVALALTPRRAARVYLPNGRERARDRASTIQGSLASRERVEPARVGRERGLERGFNLV